MMRTRRILLALCCVALLACDREYPWEADLTASPTASALDVTRHVSTTDLVDDAGDARLRSGDPAPGYLDQLGAIVTPVDERTLRFVDHLAAPLPSNAPVPKGDASIGWSFCLDTDPDYAGVGFPMDNVRPCEFVLRARWDGRKLQGSLIDRRPLLEGRWSLFHSVQPTWRKSSMELLIPIEDLGSPKRFEWSISTEELSSRSNDAVYHVDELPEGANARPATWRS
jgi:hypothetical protein